MPTASRQAAWPPALVALVAVPGLDGRLRHLRLVHLLRATDVVHLRPLTRGVTLRVADVGAGVEQVALPDRDRYAQRTVGTFARVRSAAVSGAVLAPVGHRSALAMSRRTFSNPLSGVG